MQVMLINCWSQATLGGYCQTYRESVLTWCLNCAPTFILLKLELQRSSDPGM